MSVARIRINGDWNTWETFECYTSFTIRYAELRYLKARFKVDEIVCNVCYPRNKNGIDAMILLATKESI